MSKGAERDHLLISTASANGPDVMGVHLSLAFMVSDAGAEGANAELPGNAALVPTDPFLMALARDRRIGLSSHHAGAFTALWEHRSSG